MHCVSNGRGGLGWLFSFCGLVGILSGCGQDALSPGQPPGLPTVDSPARPVAIVPDSPGVAPTAKGRAPVSVRVVDGQGRGVPGVRLRWQVLAGGGQVTPGGAATNTDGVADAVWLLGLRVDEIQLLEVAGVGLPPLRLAARVRADSIIIGTSSAVVTDTIGAELPDLVRLSLHQRDGNPVIGARVDFVVAQGGGSITPSFVQSDSSGNVSAVWQLGTTVGPQKLVASVSGGGQALLRVSGPGSEPGSTDGATQVTFDAIALAGQPASARIPVDSILLDAFGATAEAELVLFDRGGNLADPRPASWTSLAPQVVEASADGAFRALAAGRASIVAQAGELADTLTVMVVQKPANIRLRVPADTINRLGDTLAVAGAVVDRLDNEIRDAELAWRNLTPLRAEMVTGGTVVPTAPGRLRVELSAGSLVDTARMFVRQVAASVLPVRAADTVQLDSLWNLQVEVRDSNGFLILAPVVAVTSHDPSVVRPDSGLKILGLLPGTTRLTLASGPVQATTSVTVEGSALLVGGQRRSTPGSIGGLHRLEITNGRVRVVWDPSHLTEAGGFEFDVRDGDRWLPANARGVGDWLYIGYSVMTLPDITIERIGADLVALKMQFDDHRFAPPGFPAPADWVSQAYPFARTVYLREGDNGYYSWVDVQGDLGRLDVEHENGFGGLWGPATIRTSQVTIRTDTLAHTVVYNGNPRSATLEGARTEAAEFVRDGDPVRHVLVPLPGAPMITPVFDVGFGSVYVYRGPSVDFGAYMYADLGSGPSARSVCSQAWGSAPFPLPSVSAADLAGCGPSS